MRFLRILYVSFYPSREWTPKQLMVNGNGLMGGIMEDGWRYYFLFGLGLFGYG